MALQEKLGGYLSHPLLKALDEMFPDRLPPLGTPPEEVRDRMAQRQVIDTMWACWRGSSSSDLEQGLAEHTAGQ